MIVTFVFVSYVCVGFFVYCCFILFEPVSIKNLLSLPAIEREFHLKGSGDFTNQTHTDTETRMRTQKGTCSHTNITTSLSKAQHNNGWWMEKNVFTSRFPRNQQKIKFPMSYTIFYHTHTHTHTKQLIRWKGSHFRAGNAVVYIMNHNVTLYKIHFDSTLLPI